MSSKLKREEKGGQYRRKIRSLPKSLPYSFDLLYDLKDRDSLTEHYTRLIQEVDGLEELINRYAK